MTMTAGQRKPNVSFNIEFFTHRMEPEKSAKFATDYAERFTTPPMEARPEAQDCNARCLRCCLMLPPTVYRRLLGLWVLKSRHGMQSMNDHGGCSPRSRLAW